MNILAIAAHPDDIELNTAGTLAKYKQNGHKIIFLITTNGSAGAFNIGKEELAKIRQEEQKLSAKIFDAEAHFLNHDDGMLREEDIRMSVIDIIRKYDPEVIFTHYPEDTSNDHRQTANAVVSSLITLMYPNIKSEYKPITKRPTVFFWEPNGSLGFVPDVYVDITNEFEMKKSSFACHKSQIESDKRWLDDLNIVSRFRGFQFGCEYAEGFKACQFFGMMPNYKLLP